MGLQSHNQGVADDGTVKYHMYPGMFESTPMGEPLKTTKDQCELSCNEGPRTSARVAIAYFCMLQLWLVKDTPTVRTPKCVVKQLKS